jgi:hypothetical protein
LQASLPADELFANIQSLMEYETIADRVSYNATETDEKDIRNAVAGNKRKLAEKLHMLNNFAHKCKLSPILDDAEQMDFDRIADICLSLLENNERKSKEEAFLAEKDRKNAKTKNSK